MYKKPSYINIKKIRSHWYSNIIEEWHPDPEYIDYLKQKIKKKEYLPAIILVGEADAYVIVSGHHRFYAHVVAGEKRIKAFVLDGKFADTEPLRKAEVLLKKYDQKTKYKYQFSGYLDRWAAVAEKHEFINKYRPIHRIAKTQTPFPSAASGIPRHPKIQSPSLPTDSLVRSHHQPVASERID